MTHSEQRLREAIAGIDSWDNKVLSEAITELIALRQQREAEQKEVTALRQEVAELQAVNHQLLDELVQYRNQSPSILAADEARREAEAKLKASEAAAAMMRRTLFSSPVPPENLSHCRCGGYGNHYEICENNPALATDAGKGLLERVKRIEDALKEIRDYSANDGYAFDQMTEMRRIAAEVLDKLREVRPDANS